MLLAIFWPVVFHGTFDFFLFVGNTWLHFAGAVVSFIVAVKLSLKLIRRKQRFSKAHYEGIDSITGNNHDILKTKNYENLFCKIHFFTAAQCCGINRTGTNR
jgi:hypothetical protein